MGAVGLGGQGGRGRVGRWRLGLGFFFCIWGFVVGFGFPAFGCEVLGLVVWDLGIGFGIWGFGFGVVGFGDWVWSFGGWGLGLYAPAPRNPPEISEIYAPALFGIFAPALSEFGVGCIRSRTPHPPGSLGAVCEDYPQEADLQGYLAHEKTPTPLGPP